MGRLASAAIKLTHDPEKWTPAFHRDKRKIAFARRPCANIKARTRLRFDLTQSRSGVSRKPGASPGFFRPMGSAPEPRRLQSANTLPGAVKKFLALALKFFLRNPEACNSRRNFLALSREIFFKFGHAGPLACCDSAESCPAHWHRGLRRDCGTSSGDCRSVQELIEIFIAAIKKLPRL